MHKQDALPSQGNVQRWYQHFFKSENLADCINVEVNVRGHLNILINLMNDVIILWNAMNSLL